MIQGKIERFYRSIDNVIRLRNFFYPRVLQRAISELVDYYNQYRYHEALDNMTPADLYFRRVQEVKSRREQIKEATVRQRRELNSGTPSLWPAAVSAKGQSISMLSHDLSRMF